MATVCGETSAEAIQLQMLKNFLAPRITMNEGEPFGICFVNVEGYNQRNRGNKSWENKEEAAIV